MQRTGWGCAHLVRGLQLGLLKDLLRLRLRGTHDGTEERSMGREKEKGGFGRECEQVWQRAKHPESGTANVDSLDPVPGVIVIQRLPFGQGPLRHWLYCNTVM